MGKGAAGQGKAMRTRGIAAVVAGELWLLAGQAAGAGPMDRLKGVADHAKSRIEGGPDHLWTGIAIGAVVVLVIAAAAYATLRKKK